MKSSRYTSLLFLITCLGMVFNDPIAAQPAEARNHLLSRNQLLELAVETRNLMESTAVAYPGLVQAAAPLVENIRQAIQAMQTTLDPYHAGMTYRILRSAEAYLALTGALPPAASVPEAVAGQMEQLRVAVDRLQLHFSALLDYQWQLIRNPDRDQLSRYREANKQLGPPDLRNPRVVFLGDSITDGWRLNEYFPEKDFVNRGISGQITGQMLGRMKQDVIDLKPSVVVILGGTNDLARGIPLELIQNNLTMMCDLAEKYGIRVVLASLLPVHDYYKDKDPRFERTKQRPPELIQTLNRWIREFCRQRGYVYLDYYSAMVDASGRMKQELSDDGLHPNNAGYRVMAPLALEAINRALQSMSRRR